METTWQGTVTRGKVLFLSAGREGACRGRVAHPATFIRGGTD